MKDKIITFSFIGYILFFGIFHFVLTDKEISISERRKLTTFPELELTSDYITKVDKYLLDHFPFRDEFRSLKANFNYKILNKLDNNDIYLKDNYIFKSEYPTDDKSISKFKEKVNKLMSLLSSNNETYIMIVPDKNYYLEDYDFLQLDYDYIYGKINELNLTEIDIRNLMELDDYYETDTHWKQEKLDKVIKKMSEVMDFDYEIQEYKENKYNKFYGVYYGESAISREPETLTYLTNDDINNVSVKYLENKELTKIYNLEKLESLDSYEVYLDGASSFIEIENANSRSNKELIIFRDSFGSSITPLLVKYYAKITLVDNRYINSDTFKNLIEFKDQDVLFLYSTLIVNNGSSLKG
ncbi:MAG: hypothetical protein IJB71_03705 [Bacilli bacterium]|nr:hypothetical protein [Bacilli bacterium]